MLKLDMGNMFSYDQELDSTNATNGTNTIEMFRTDTYHDQTIGNRLAVRLIGTGSTGTLGNNQTLKVDVVTDTESDQSGTSTVVATRTLTNAEVKSLAGGQDYYIPIPFGKLASRYLGLVYTATALSNTIKVEVTAHLVTLADQDQWKPVTVASVGL